MGTLVDDFGGKVSGELIRASDWNNLLGAVEACLTALETRLGERIAPLETATADLSARVSTLEGSIADLAGLAQALRTRQRHLTLSAATRQFAIGQLGLITANIAKLDPGAADLDLSDPATRPWVDFSTSWGTLRAAPGFTSQGGANDKTLSVRVNEAGDAQVQIRADHAEAFDEEEELEIQAVLDTTVTVGSVVMPVHQALLQANTPTSAGALPAYQVMTQAYERTDTRAVQRYTDAYYLANPSRLAGEITSRFNQRWRDYRAVVTAVAKPDAEPTTPDSAMAVASLLVTFRDWIGPWITLEYVPNIQTRALDLRDRFAPRVGQDFDLAVRGIMDVLDETSTGSGIIGQQRELRAAEQAVREITLDAPPSFFGELVDAVTGGIGVQRSLAYGNAVTPGAATRANQAARALASTTSKAVSETQRARTDLGDQIANDVSEVRDQLVNEINVSQTAFREEMLADDGLFLSVQSQLSDVLAQVEGVNTALSAKADLQFVTDIVQLNR